MCRLLNYSDISGGAMIALMVLRVDVNWLLKGSLLGLLDLLVQRCRTHGPHLGELVFHGPCIV